MTNNSEIQTDPQNARKHSKVNKEAIHDSIRGLGAGRSVLLDADNVLIAGNGVFEQAKKLGLPVKVVETDGTELIAVKRTDLKTEDEKRKALALADNRLTDLSSFDTEALNTMLDELDEDLRALAGFKEDLEEENAGNDVQLPEEQYQVLCECESETEQQEVYELLESKGYKCRPITL